MIDFDKEIWEGWTVKDFIDYFETEIAMIMGGCSYIKPFIDKAHLQLYIISNQPYYKKAIPEVIDYFVDKYGLK